MTQYLKKTAIPPTKSVFEKKNCLSYLTNNLNRKIFIYQIYSAVDQYIEKSKENNFFLPKTSKVRG